MAAAGRSRVGVCDVTCIRSNGHDVLYNFSLFNAAALQQRWTFTQNFCTLCITSPTSWRFTLTLLRNPNSGVDFGEAIREGNYSLNIPAAAAHFVLTFRHSAFSLEFVSGSCGRSYMHSIVPDQFEHLLQGKILVVVHISVRDCHPDKKEKGPAIPGVGASRKKM
ncbi:hypothetical protein AVEN_229025-1 [Araneus ventricosus]|uniref:Uncharacterized protein n=1 Tax=Araneus ventricosus TaxID=182803 RepID=A0A4Y2KPK2_ARAVE|nr:hypothetical protein AVEN_229025-1 [Araneus ventricosus]